MIAIIILTIWENAMTKLEANMVDNSWYHVSPAHCPPLDIDICHQIQIMAQTPSENITAFLVKVFRILWPLKSKPKSIMRLSACCTRGFSHHCGWWKLPRATPKNEIKTFRRDLASSPSTAMLASKHISGPRLACTWPHGILGICSGFSPCNPHLQMSMHASSKFESLQNDQPYAQNNASWVCICKGAAAQPNSVQTAIDRMQSAACKATWPL